MRPGFLRQDSGSSMILKIFYTKIYIRAPILIFLPLQGSKNFPLSSDCTQDYNNYQTSRDSLSISFYGFIAPQAREVAHADELSWSTYDIM